MKAMDNAIFFKARFVLLADALFVLFQDKWGWVAITPTGNRHTKVSGAQQEDGTLTLNIGAGIL